MGSFGGYYFGEKKKLKKQTIEKKAAKTESSFFLPKIEIIGKGKKRE